MIDLESVIRRDLGAVLPLPPGLEPDWDDVRRRVRPEPSPVRPGLLVRARRRPILAIALLLLLAVAIPVSAVGIVRGDPWWIIHPGVPGTLPVKGTSVVVSRGTWSGHRWVLTAYRSTGLGLCFQVSAVVNGRPSERGGSCAPFVGLPRLPGRREPLSITFLGGGGGPTHVRGYLPRYIVGPVVPTATTVRIRLSNGSTLETPTFAAPAALGVDVRFYATQTSSPSSYGPGCRQQAQALASISPSMLTGLDSTGRVVARLVTGPAALKRLSTLLCKPPVERLAPGNAPRAATATIRPVAHFSAPYGATATLAVGKVVPIPYGRPLANGGIKRIKVPSRCWRVSFNDGNRQGTCSSQVKRTNPQYFLDYNEVEHVGHAVFVIAHAAARTGPQVDRITLRLSSGRLLSAKPVDGVVVFAVPRSDLVVAAQRHKLTAYDPNGRVLGQEHVFYRSCPSASASGGTC